LPDDGCVGGPEIGFGKAGVFTAAGKRITARTVLITRKKDGKEVSNQRTVNSKDGKTRTSYWKDKDEKGEPITWTAVFDRP
jgi:hypothetical protein